MPSTRQAARVVFLDRDTLPADVELGDSTSRNELVEFGATSPADVGERIAAAEIVITNKVPIRREAIATAPNLRLVAIAATGSDNVDIRACAERGVAVSNIRDYAVNTVPEHTFALILALRRSVLAYRESVRGGRWQDAGRFCYFGYPIRDLAGSTLGVIGDGALGRSVAQTGGRGALGPPSLNRRTLAR